LAKKLGYDSVDELEVAMDTMEGVAEDGGELTDGLAREARIRSAYIQWCKDYEKEPDESRFPTFSSNFLAMEEYASESGKEMSLNSYADMTEEEYLAATSTPEPAPVAKGKTEAEKKADEAAAAKKKAATEAKAKEEAEGKIVSLVLCRFLVRGMTTHFDVNIVFNRIRSQEESRSIGRGSSKGGRKRSSCSPGCTSQGFGGDCIR
jgi:hypothetical protein